MNPSWRSLLQLQVKLPILKLIAFMVGGAALGFAYQHFIGCRTGSCPITSNPYISTAYGALVGLVAAGGWKRPKPVREIE